VRVESNAQERGAIVHTFFEEGEEGFHSLIIERGLGG
jgi:hypothetical protein